MPEVPAEHTLSPHARASHTLIDIGYGAFCRTAAPDIDQNRGRDDLAHQRIGGDSCVAALHVWIGQHPNGIADDRMRVIMNCARTRSAKRPIREMRLWATEVPSR